MIKNLDNRAFIGVVTISFLSFAFLDIIKFSVFDGGVDSGYYLSTARDWFKLGRIPNFDTYNIYSPIGVMFYAIPYILFDHPDITVFLSLNLFLYLISCMLFLKIAHNLFGKSILTIVLLLSFLYNTHGIVNDIKLENLVLVFGLLIVNCFNKLIAVSNGYKKNWGFREALIIGVLCALSFLTKQFGGLSLILSLVIATVMFYESSLRLAATITGSFFFVVAIYLLIQISTGLPVEIVFSQLKGEILLQCVGSVYGAKKIKYIFFGIKYFKFDGFVYLFVLSVVTFVKKVLFGQCLRHQDTQFLKIIFLFMVMLFISLFPFYFQVYPHYVFFGIPFVYFASMLMLNALLGISDGVIFGSFVKLIGLFTLFMSIYSASKWFEQYKSIKMKKELSLNLERNINSKLKKGTLVHCLQNRKLWFKCEFVTPFPKTIGYAYLQMPCLEKALHLEKPESFWVIGRVNLNGEPFRGYSVIKRYEFVGGGEKYNAVHFHRKVGD